MFQFQLIRSTYARILTFGGTIPAYGKDQEKTYRKQVKLSLAGLPCGRQGRNKKNPIEKNLSMQILDFRDNL